jgi:hypothetical protein
MDTTRFVFSLLVNNRCLKKSSCLLFRLLVDPEDGESMFFLNVGELIPFTWYNIPEDNHLLGIAAFLDFVHRRIF